MQRRHLVPACTLLGLTLLALSGPARAQQPALPSAPDATQPPAAGQPSRLAEERFAEGATLFKQWRFEEAEQRFREALTHQDHALIHLYLSRTLEKQGRLVEAHEALQPALRPDAEPLSPEEVQVAEELRQSLESRLSQIEVHCDEPGTEVFLDGEPWFTAPGRRRRMITAGQHVLMARKPGYFPVAEQVSLIPGKQTSVVLRMTADVVHVQRRWQPWKPWVATGTGIAMSLAGRLLWRQARSDHAAYERTIADCEQASCAQVPTRRRDTGKRSDVLGTSALITGSALLAAGLAGVLINQPRTRRSEPTGRELEFDIAPLVSGDTAGISARIWF